MLYTSYFAKISELREHDIIPVSIALKSPVWWIDKEYKRLAPTYSIVPQYKITNNKEDYICRYNKEILDNLNPVSVLYDLNKIGDFLTDIALICYEESEEFCHRHLVSDWFQRNGIRCEEWEK